MPITETRDNQFVKIIEEKRLSGLTVAMLDELGAITIIDDESKEPGVTLDVEQMFVSLSARAALALRNLLNEPRVVQLLKANA